MKQPRTNIKTHAKATVALAGCILAVSAAGLQAADKQSENSSTATSQSQSQGTPGAGSGSQAGGQLSNSDQKFIQKAAKGGMMEVQMGKLGVKSAQNPSVKQYAQRLIDDHTKANQELKQLASSKGITLPDDSLASTDSSSSSDKTKVRDTESGSHDASQHDASEQQAQAHMKKLQALSGSDFDREFIRMAVADHEKDVKEFEKEAQKAQDSDVKAFAQKTAPTLREHLQQAKSLETQVGAPSSSSGSTTGSSQSSSSDRTGSAGSSSTSSGTSTTPSGTSQSK